MDEGFHNVLSAICSACGGRYYRKCGRWMKGFNVLSEICNRQLGYYGVLINCVRCTV